MADKICSTFDEAVSDIEDGATVLMHSFVGPAGVAQNLIHALVKKNVKDLTVVSCNFAPGFVAGRLMPGLVTPMRLVENNQVKKVVTSVVSLSRIIPDFEDVLEKAVKAGKIEVELVGQGTLAERIRAGGAGIGGFYTRVGVGTIVEAGKEKRTIDGKQYLFEKPIWGDFAFVRAQRSDVFGNLTYKGTARSFNPLIATAATVTVAEVDEIVAVGQQDPECVVTPGIYVNRIVKRPEGRDA
jgi:3-oxoacid CoA-transferase A subunit